MLVFVIRRLLQAVIVLLAVGFVAFALFQYVGDPVQNLLGQQASPSQVKRLRADLGLDQPFFVQYAHFLQNAVQGRFGVSLRQGVKVSALMAERFPATLELAVVSAMTALLVGVPLGVYSALGRARMAGQLMMTFILVVASLPTFLVGVLLILFFTLHLSWLPGFGRGELVSVGFWQTGLLTTDGWRHIALPALTLATFQVALVARLVSGQMLEVLRTGYIRFAHARGLPRRIIYFGHALKNALLPLLTVTGLQLGGLMAYAVVTETVFQWPGMGSLLLQAVHFADIPVMAACLCFIAFVFVLINLLVDILYWHLDPRLRVERSTRV
jgi:peptide/nickel transport system permease protein